VIHLEAAGKGGPKKDHLKKPNFKDPQHQARLKRLALMEIEEGRKKAWVTLARTMVVVYFCYLTMTSLSLQILFLAFPELLLVLVVIEIWLGRWTGLRLSEWFRFRAMLGRPQGATR
jgi:hypothetical protein